MKIYKGFDINKCLNPASIWPCVPYAGEDTPPVPEEPAAGQWPTYFLGRNSRNKFTDKDGNVINFNIRRPDMSIDFKGKQLDEVEETLINITKRQIKIAQYWGEGPATKQWTPIIDRLIDTYDLTAPEAGRVLASVQGALNDAFVVSWYYKFLWNIARPNQLNRKLITVLCTPNHPSYPSGHATIAGCAQVVLSYFFRGERKQLNTLAVECANSRLYAGVHFPVDNSEGLILGRQIGEIAVKKLASQEVNGEPIDKPYTKNLNAKLPPPPYKQVISFKGNMECDSYTIFNT